MLSAARAGKLKIRPVDIRRISADLIQFLAKKYDTEEPATSRSMILNALFKLSSVCLIYLTFSAADELFLWYAANIFTRGCNNLCM